VASDEFANRWEVASMRVQVLAMPISGLDVDVIIARLGKMARCDDPEAILPMINIRNGMEDDIPVLSSMGYVVQAVCKES
jgi:hypothetical protein